MDDSFADEDDRFEKASFGLQRYARRISAIARRIEPSPTNSALHLMQQHVATESIQLASAVTVIELVLRQSWFQLPEVTPGRHDCL